MCVHIIDLYMYMYMYMLYINVYTCTSHDMLTMHDKTPGKRRHLTFQAGRILAHAASVLIVEGQRPDALRRHHVLLLRAAAAHQLRVVTEEVASHQARLVALTHRVPIDRCNDTMCKHTLQ